jgi:hypothetical protein
MKEDIDDTLDTKRRLEELQTLIDIIAFLGSLPGICAIDYIAMHLLLEKYSQKGILGKLHVLDFPNRPKASIQLGLHLRLLPFIPIDLYLPSHNRHDNPP